MRSLYLSILFILIAIQINGQLLGARNAAMAQVSLSQDDAFSSLQNISKLAESTRLEIGITAQSSFLLKELKKANLVLKIPLFKGGFGFRYFQYGYAHYLKNQFEFAYSIPFNSSFSMGVKINFLLHQLGEKRPANYFLYPDVGMNYAINEKTEVGILLSNISLSRVEQNSQLIPLPSILMGFSYRINKKFRLHLESMLNIDQDVELKFAFEYNIHEYFFLRSGSNLSENSIAFGFGIKFSNWQVDFASSYHSTLGFSPAISLRYAKRNQ